MISTEIGPITCLCFSTFAWPYLINNTTPLLPAPPITEAGCSNGNGKPKWFSVLEEGAELWKSEQSLRWKKTEMWDTISKSPANRHGERALGHSWERGGSLHPAGLTCGCPQANHCLVKGGDWSQQTLPSDFTPHSFAQTLLGPLQPWLGSPGSSAPPGCSLAQQAAQWHLLSATDRLLGMNRTSHQPEHVCAHKLHLQFWHRLLGEDFTLERNFTFENQKQSFVSFGGLTYYSSYNWTLTICLNWMQIFVQ